MIDHPVKPSPLLVHTERHTELLLLRERLAHLRERTAALVAQSQADRARRQRERKIVRCLRALDCSPVHSEVLK